MTRRISSVGVVYHLCSALDEANLGGESNSQMRVNKRERKL